MADDLDLAIGAGGSLPYSSAELRAYFRQRVAVVGVDAALADAQVRYQRQVLCELLALDDSGIVVHREVQP